MPTYLTLGVNPECKQDFTMVWSLFSSSIGGPDLLPFSKLVGPDVPPFSQHPLGIPWRGQSNAIVQGGGTR